MATLSSLPLELVTNVVSFVDRPSLKNLRTTCRLLSRLATERLFESLTLAPKDSSYNAFEAVLGHETLSKLVKKVYFKTKEYVTDPANKGEEDLEEKFEELVPRLGCFRNLQGVVICFDKHCFVDRNWYSTTYPQTLEFRSEVMELVFSSMFKLRELPRELAIRNLQNVNQSDSEVSASIAQVLRNLHTLRLNIVSEYDEAAPENTITIPELHSFFTELPSIWLRPTVTTLRHLTLYCDHYFGFWPKLDLSNIHFPLLKTLALGNYSFVQDSQLDWILSHGSTLRELYFDDCMIIYKAHIYEENLGRCSVPRTQMLKEVERVGYPQDRYKYTYAKRWHHYFEAFDSHLPCLQHFVFGSGNWYSGAPFEEEGRLQNALHNERYFLCRDGTGPSPYLYPGHNTDPERPVCDQEDRDGLHSLLRKLGQRIIEDADEHDESL